MSRIDTSIQDLFLRLGTTPASRSAKASSLFRQLRDEEERDLRSILFTAPSLVALRNPTRGDQEPHHQKEEE